MDQDDESEYKCQSCKKYFSYGQCVLCEALVCGGCMTDCSECETRSCNNCTNHTCKFYDTTFGKISEDRLALLHKRMHSENDNDEELELYEVKMYTEACKVKNAEQNNSQPLN